MYVIHTYITPSLLSATCVYCQLAPLRLLLLRINKPFLAVSLSLVSSLSYSYFLIGIIAEKKNLNKYNPKFNYIRITKLKTKFSLDLPTPTLSLPMKATMKKHKLKVKEKVHDTCHSYFRKKFLMVHRNKKKTTKTQKKQSILPHLQWQPCRWSRGRTEMVRPTLGHPRSRLE